MEKKNSFHHSNLGNNYLSIYRDYLSLLCMHDCLALSEISIDCNKYTPIIVQLCLKDEDLKCIKRVSETIQCLEKWQHNEAVKLCSYVSFVPLCCVFASGQGLSCYLRPVGKAITCLSHPCSEVGCWVWNILKSISLHWKKNQQSFPVMEATDLSQTFALTLALTSDIQVNCISRDFHPPGSDLDKILKKRRRE